MSSGERYLAAAYVAVLVALLVWVAIVSLKLSRLGRELDELARLARRAGERDREPDAERERTPVG